MTAASRAHSQTGEKSRSTLVPVIGLRSSFALGDRERRGGRDEEREDYQRLGLATAPGRSRRVEPAHEDEGLGVLATTGRPVMRGGRADGALAPRVRELLRSVS